MKIRSFTLLISSIFFVEPTCLRAETVTSEAFISGYENYAFPSPQSRLIKPQQNASTTISVHCLKEDFCNVIIPELKKYLRAYWLVVVETKEFDPNAAISVEVTYGFDTAEDGRPARAIEHLNIKLHGKEELYRDGRDNCIGINVRQDDLISHTIVAANLLGSNERYVSCVILGLAYGLGLKPNPTYDQAWTDVGGLGRATDSEFSQFMKVTGRLIALHTNPLSSAGSSKEEFERQFIGMDLPKLLGEQ